MSLIDLPADIRDRARRIRLVAFDIDGVMTDGGICYTGTGEEFKTFHVQDGLGLQLLRKAGIQLAIVTGRSSPIVARRAEELGIEYVFQGVKDKRDCLRTLASRLGFSQEQTAFVGDDWPDLAAMRAAGLGIAVANAHPIVKQHAHWRTARSGGDAAVREVADMILIAQDRLDTLLAEYLA